MYNAAIHVSISPSELPQPAGTLAKVSKFHLLVNLNHIQILSKYIIELTIVNQ